MTVLAHGPASGRTPLERGAHHGPYREAQRSTRQSLVVRCNSPLTTGRATNVPWRDGSPAVGWSSNRRCCCYLRACPCRWSDRNGDPRCGGRGSLEDLAVVSADQLHREDHGSRPRAVLPAGTEPATFACKAAPHTVPKTPKRLRHQAIRANPLVPRISGDCAELTGIKALMPTRSPALDAARVRRSVPSRRRRGRGAWVCRARLACG